MYIFFFLYATYATGATLYYISCPVLSKSTLLSSYPGNTKSFYNHYLYYPYPQDTFFHFLELLHKLSLILLY